MGTWQPFVYATSRFSLQVTFASPPWKLSRNPAIPPSPCSKPVAELRRTAKTLTNTASLAIQQVHTSVTLLACSASLSVTTDSASTTLASSPVDLLGQKPQHTAHQSSADISQYLQYLEKVVYNITDPKELTLCSTHTLWVGACVILHATDFTDLRIQFNLLWRSLAFMSYLRNLTALSDNQNKAFNAFTTPRDLPTHLTLL